MVGSRPRQRALACSQGAGHGADWGWGAACAQETEAGAAASGRRQQRASHRLPALPVNCESPDCTRRGRRGPRPAPEQAQPAGAGDAQQVAHKGRRRHHRREEQQQPGEARQAGGPAAHALQGRQARRLLLCPLAQQLLRLRGGARAQAPAEGSAGHPGRHACRHPQAGGAEHGAAAPVAHPHQSGPGRGLPALLRTVKKGRESNPCLPPRPPCSTHLCHRGAVAPCKARVPARQPLGQQQQQRLAPVGLRGGNRGGRSSGRLPGLQAAPRSKGDEPSGGRTPAPLAASRPHPSLLPHLCSLAACSPPPCLHVDGIEEGLPGVVAPAERPLHAASQLPPGGRHSRAHPPASGRPACRHCSRRRLRDLGCQACARRETRALRDSRMRRESCWQVRARCCRVHAPPAGRQQHCRSSSRGRGR